MTASSTREAPARLRLVILVVWITGFLIGTVTHVLDLIAGGGDTYAEFPLPLRLFWVSLTILDPITAMLLALRHRAGIVFGVVIIWADIAVNWTVFATLGGNPLFGVVNQTLFAAVLLATAKPLWNWFAGAPGRSRYSSD